MNKNIKNDNENWLKIEWNEMKNKIQTKND